MKTSPIEMLEPQIPASIVWQIMVMVARSRQVADEVHWTEVKFERLCEARKK